MITLPLTAKQVRVRNELELQEIYTAYHNALKNGRLPVRNGRVQNIGDFVLDWVPTGSPVFAQKFEDGEYFTGKKVKYLVGA